MRQILNRVPPALTQGLALHGAVAGLAAALRVARVANPRVKRSVEDFCATYQFVSGNSVRRLVFENGKIRSRRGRADNPDYEVTIHDLPGAVRILKEEPNNLLRLMVANKIDQTGNTWYLFRLGYLAGLMERQARDLAAVAAEIKRKLPFAAAKPLRSS